MGRQIPVAQNGPPASLPALLHLAPSSLPPTPQPLSALMHVGCASLLPLRPNAHRIRCALESHDPYKPTPTELDVHWGFVVWVLGLHRVSCSLWGVLVASFGCHGSLWAKKGAKTSVKSQRALEACRPFHCLWIFCLLQGVWGGGGAPSGQNNKIIILYPPHWVTPPVKSHPTYASCIR